MHLAEPHYARECPNPIERVQFRHSYVHEKFRRRRAVKFDPINCPLGSKTSELFNYFHEHRDGTVYTLDGTQVVFNPGTFGQKYVHENFEKIQ